MNKEKTKFISLGSRLRGIVGISTLGVKPNFFDYTPKEREMIFRAKMILYPSRNYAQLFTTIGKRIFPSLETHLYAEEKIMQTTLFNMLEIPHPRTKFYYHLHHDGVLKEFSFPFIGKLPRHSAGGRGVFMISNQEDLDRYLKHCPVAYIQEHLPHTRDLRVILINYDPILAYWRESPPGDFRTNVYQGGRISFDDIPREAIVLAQESARKCRFDDVGLDLIKCRGKWYVIEANMKYGREGLKMKGLNLKQIILKKLLSGNIS